MQKLWIGLMAVAGAVVSMPASAQDTWVNGPGTEIGVTTEYGYNDGPYGWNPGYDAYGYEPGYSTTIRTYVDRRPIRTRRSVEVDATVAAPGYNAYAYAPGYNTYAAEPGYVYGGVGPVTYQGRCWVSTENTKAFGYWGSCRSSTVDTDAETLGQAERNVSPARP